MNYKNALYLALTWLITVAVAYAAGWWSGLKSVTRAASGAVSSGFPILLGALVLIAAAAAIAAFLARGYLDRRGT